jgi:hypothetical protein
VTRQALVDDLLPRLLANESSATAPSPSATETFALGYHISLALYLQKAQRETVWVTLSAQPAAPCDPDMHAAWRLSCKVSAQLPGQAQGEYVVASSSSGSGDSGDGFNLKVLDFTSGNKSITSVADWDEMVLVDGVLRIKVEVSAYSK